MSKTLSQFSQEDLEKHKTTKNNSTFDQYNKLKNLSQSQANDMLFEEVKKQKKNGTFNFQNLQRQVEAFKDYLSPQDYENLQKLLNSLK